MARKIRKKEEEMKMKEGKSKLSDDSRLFAFLAVLLSVVGFIIALVAKKDDKYVIFYAKQSLILFLTGIAVKVLTVLLAITIIGIIAIPIVWVLYAVIWVVVLVNSISGKEKEAPIVGKYARSIKL